MGDKPPMMTARQPGKVLSRFGWTRRPRRGKGGHIGWQRPRPDGGTDYTQIPTHKGKTLPRGMIWGILRQASLSWDGRAKKGKGDFYEIRRAD